VSGVAVSAIARDRIASVGMSLGHYKRRTSPARAPAGRRATPSGESF
jgi:hypothetical protein